MEQKTAIVLGAGGFIGSHLVRRLKKESYHVVGVDLKFPEFSKSEADLFLIGNLNEPLFLQNILAQQKQIDEIYQLAAEMGGAGFIFSGEHDAEILRKSTQTNLCLLEALLRFRVGQIFFSSSACVYPKGRQEDLENSKMREDFVYPADPDSDYGWEKLFSERLYLAHGRNCGMNVRIARFHNVYGPEGTYSGGREKVIGALCRKIAEAKEGDEIEIWGDGNQSRSFLYIDDCLEGIRRLMQSCFSEPLNLGSEESISIRHLAEMISHMAGKNLKFKFVRGPVGVKCRNSDNTLMQKTLNWMPTRSLREGLELTYAWINHRMFIP